MEKEVNFGKLLHGGDYNPEQWLDYPEILEQDLAYFKKARINEVSLGMFSWAFLEPEEGVFRLEWLKEVIDRLYENEIVVMLSTPTAARPPENRIRRRRPPIDVNTFSAISHLLPLAHAPAQPRRPLLPAHR